VDRPDVAGGLTRRRFLVAAAGGVTAAAGASLAAGQRRAAERLSLPPLPPARPERQHAWDASLAVDQFGNRVAPRHHLLLMFDPVGRPSVQGAVRLEGALRELERLYPWGPAGLLITLGWGPRWFRSLGRPAPIEPPRALSDTELPDLDDHACCLHLASDDKLRLVAVDHAVTGGRRLPGARFPLDLRPVLRVRARRSGFVGPGLPAAHQRGTAGLPADLPIGRRAPLFMGFRSGFRRNQASEAAITIPDGPFAGATTMHVSVLALALDSWYRSLDDPARAARMFAPQLTIAQVRGLRDAVPVPADTIGQTARRYGVVGHAQAAAQARRHGQPRILRRDFNSVDGGQALVHFVALQRSVADFVATRRAMDAAAAPAANPAIGAQVNNGINEWLTVRHRANYLVPPRSRRAFPLLPGWDEGDPT
jgi:hypothetical protein